MSFTSKIHGVTNISANFTPEFKSNDTPIPPCLYLKISQKDYDSRPIRRELQFHIYAADSISGDLLHDIFLAIDKATTTHQYQEKAEETK